MVSVAVGAKDVGVSPVRGQTVDREILRNIMESSFSERLNCFLFRCSVFHYLVICSRLAGPQTFGQNY